MKNPLINIYLALLQLFIGMTLISHSLLNIFFFSFNEIPHYFIHLGLPYWLTYPFLVIEMMTGMMFILGFRARTVAFSLLPFMMSVMAFALVKA